MDLSDRQSITACNQILDELNQVGKIADTTNFVIGMKSDRTQVNDADLNVFAKRTYAKAFRCSQQNQGKSCQEAFEQIWREVLKKYTGR